jgi:hypothetical protein
MVFLFWGNFEKYKAQPPLKERFRCIALHFVKFSKLISFDTVQVYMVMSIWYMQLLFFLPQKNKIKG